MYDTRTVVEQNYDVDEGCWIEKEKVEQQVQVQVRLVERRLQLSQGAQDKGQGGGG